MYFPSYNPILHDVYLYGPGNSGMPIGLNTNCVLYDARESYKTVGLRVRRYGPDGVSLNGFTTGLSIEQWPNWWNSNIPLAWKLSPSYLSGCVHYMSAKPSDCEPGVFGLCTLVKQTGMTANYGWAFWHPNFDGYTYYTGLEGIYNCVATETEYPSPVYFSGSPEIPGFANGATFYLISQSDFGLMKFRSDANPSEASGPFVESVSIFSVLKDQNIDLENYLVDQGSETDPSFALYTVYPENCYIWGGSDTVAPVSQIKIRFWTAPHAMGFDTDYPMDSVEIAAYIEPNGDFWVGDSSGFLLYKKNNKFYTIMHALFPDNNGIRGPAHAGRASLMLNYIVNQTNIPTSYIKSLNIETKATMNNKLILLQNKLTQLIEKIAGVTI